MENTDSTVIEQIRLKQSNYFRSGSTLDLKFRKQALKKLQKAILDWEKALSEALWKDLHKSYEEAYICELSIVLSEIRNHLKHINAWARPQRVGTPIKMFAASSRIVSQALGNSLIIAPWNYPVQLLLNPLVGAISSGCTAVLKPSPYTPNVSTVISEMIKATFPEEYIAVVNGNREVNQTLLKMRWDLIFFTGSPSLGRKVMAAAAENLTPVVLELGGKSPCIIDRDADIAKAAKRVAWGKCLNSGQTCIAPDYLLVHEDIKTAFLGELAKEFKLLYQSDIKGSSHYVRIVNDKAFERLQGYLSNGKVLYGGECDASQRFFSPTILDDVPADAPVMQEEIFGPIFPVQSFSTLQQAIDFVNSKERPLALYYYGKSDEQIIRNTCSGGCCINDCIMHIANEKLPFGGVGNSGLGSYHGKLSFDAFSHKRAVVKTSTLLDTPFRYMPYKWFKMVKKLL